MTSGPDMNEREGPLSGTIVIDLTRVLAGPYLTMMLSEMGARVIKVETPGPGDDARHFGPFVGDESAYFATINRGKESIALNLKDPEERRILERLVGKADVVAENYRAGTMERLGLGWDRLRKINPRLVYVAVSGFGHSGPYSNRPAYDLVVQGMGGIMSMTGHGDGNPVRVGTSVGDITAGLFGVSGVLAALYDREKTGQGTKVDVAMLDCQVAILENAIGRYFAEGKVPAQTGLQHPSITPFAGLRAQNGEYLVLAAGNDTLFGKLCALLDCSDLLADQRFGSNQGRTEHSRELYERLEAALSRKPVREWLEILTDGGIPCGPINNIEQVVNDPHVAARNMIVTARGASGHPFRMPGNPLKFSAYPDPPTRGAIPGHDADREAVLRLLDGDD